jgi:hypothetical protein
LVYASRFLVSLAPFRERKRGKHKIIIIIIIIGGGFGIIIIKVRHCWLQERKKQSHQKRVLVSISVFFSNAPYFVLCFSYYVVGTVPIEFVMNLFLKKTKQV